MSISYEVGAYLRKFGVTEDGEDYVGEVLYVQAEDEVGHRWVHVTQYSTVAVETHPEEGFLMFGDIYEEVFPKVAALRDSLRVKGDAAMEDYDVWVEAEARYGSKAYSE